MSVDTDTQVDLFSRLLGDASQFESTAQFFADGTFHPVSWAQIISDGEKMTAGLSRAGVGHGSVVATVLSSGPSAASMVVGCWLRGAVLASLPTRPPGSDAQTYAEQIVGICGRLDAVMLVGDDAFVDGLAERTEDIGVVCRFEDFRDSGTAPTASVSADDVVFIQFSSGSTGSPKGCELSARAIGAQLKMLAGTTEARPGEVGVSWLPWSHDMGFFGGLLSGWWNDVTTYHSTPQRFLMSPQSWFVDMARFGAHHTAGTPTAMHVAARVTALRCKDFPGTLEQVRTVIIGAERIGWEVVQSACETLSRFGLRQESLMPAYGLAEGTLAVTATALDDLPRVIAMDTTGLAGGHLIDRKPGESDVTMIVSAGRPRPGVEIVEPREGDPEVGRIKFRSISLARGYHKDPVRTAERFVDGVFDSGDMGFVRNGELYPLGRSDDMVALGGRNVNLREVETAIEGVDDIKATNPTIVPVFVDSGHSLTLLMETGGRGVDYHQTAERAGAQAMSTAGVVIDQCLFVRRNSLPRTPSGKIQRHRCGALLDESSSAVLSRVALSDAGGGE